MRILSIFILTVLFSAVGYSQTVGQLSGRVVDKTNAGILDVVVYVKEYNQLRTRTNLDGFYELEAPVGKITLVFRLGNDEQELITTISSGKINKIDRVKFDIQFYEGVDVSARAKNEDISDLPIIEVHRIPGRSSVERYITLTTAATSNNELTDNYNVRGGSYDENLVYVNGFQIYRPFLTRSGQQEGMSFINPNLVENISFSAGGFTANYGDRLSSVLDITYRTPSRFRGSFDASFLGLSGHVEGIAGPRFDYMVAGRYQDLGYLLNALPTKGSYKPRFYDFQVLTNFKITENLTWSLLGHYSSNNYLFAPQTQETKFGTVNQPLSLKIYFEGQERTRFQTVTGATSLKWKVNNRTDVNFYASIFNTDERETFDILGEYFINELEKDPSKEEFGDSIATLGIGAYLDHARNRLQATVYSVRHEGQYQFLKLTDDGLDYINKGKLNWGWDAQYEDFHDVMSEWGLIDSAGYSLPQTNPHEVELNKVIKAENTLQTFRASAFIQYSNTLDYVKEKYPVKFKINTTDSLGNKIKYVHYDTIDNSRSQFNFNIGVRGGYTLFNNEFYGTPRAMFSYFPRKYYIDNEGIIKKRYLRLHASAGLYYQPPFYRELRNMKGEINEDVLSQKSVHVVAGVDYAFEMWKRETPFKLTSEIFYKYMWDVNPYHVDNVRTLYFAKNNAIAHSYGIDFNLHGEFVEGIESFFKMGLLHIVEDLKDDDYYTYINSDGEKIVPGFTFNNVPVDSILNSPGFIPKPTDQWFTFATLFQDRMPRFEQLTAQLGLFFGTSLPYGPPGEDRYKDVLRQKSYFRIDIGFGYDFLYGKPQESRKKFWKQFDDIHLSFEVFNLLGFKNVLSQQWIMDTEGIYYAIPNYLTDRRFNLKLTIRW